MKIKTSAKTQILIKPLKMSNWQSKSRGQKVVVKRLKHNYIVGLSLLFQHMGEFKDRRRARYIRRQPNKSRNRNAFLN